MSFILALDQGTTSSRAILFNHDGGVESVAQREFRQIFPRPGLVEHDPEEILESQLTAARDALSRVGKASSDVAAVGITNQRETTVLWDRATGRPVHNAIVWQDRRTAGECDRLRREGLAPLIRSKTGLVIDAYFSATKLRHLLDHVPGARERAGRGELAFGTIDSWLLWHLTGGAVHATDVSNASRTMLFNIHAGQWDDELLKLFDIPRSVLPDVRGSGERFGETKPARFGSAIPITGIAGDQQAALFGQGCFTPGLAKNTYGTGCFMLMNTGSNPAPSKHELLTTIAWRRGAITEYALEGAVFIGGAVVQWLRDGLKFIESASQVEALAGSVPDSGGVCLVPAFTGLGAPHWDPHARGTIVGVTRGTTAGHLARAALESIAYQVADLVDAMQADAEVPMRELRVDGGAASNNLLLQFQADLLRAPVVRPAVTETTALGAACLAGLTAGFWRDPADVQASRRIDRVFEPKMSADEATRLRSRWNRALRRALDWERHDD